MNNRLSLRYGPSPSADSITIAFVGKRALGPDGLVKVFGTQRYIPENFHHVGECVYKYGTPNQLVSVSLSTDTLVSNNHGEISTDKDGYLRFPFVNLPIQMLGLVEGLGGTWQPELEAGKFYTIRSLTIDDFEADKPVNERVSWIGRTDLQPGDTVILCYSIPEAFYGTRGYSVQTEFPGSGALLVSTYEVCELVAPNEIAYRGDPMIVTTLRIDGKKIASTYYNGEIPNSVFTGWNKETKRITMKKRYPPGTEVVIEYLALPTKYRYRGYRDHLGRWFRFDANPSPGRYIDVDNEGTKVQLETLDAFKRKVALYLLPSSVIHIKEEDLGGISLRSISAFDYGETHFLRHGVAETLTDTVTQISGSFARANKYNYAVFGKSVYDEDPIGEIITKLPPLSVVVSTLLLAPVSMDDTLSIADVRKRGGGLPEDSPISATGLSDNDIDILRSFLDLGIWNGAVRKDGGAVEIQISRSVLDKFTTQEVYDIVKSRMLPGIDFVINYV